MSYAPIGSCARQTISSTRRRLGVRFRPRAAQISAAVATARSMQAS